MKLDVYSILILDKKAVGVRFKNEAGELFDFEVEALRGIKKDHLQGHKTQTLLVRGDLLVTQEELDNGLKIKDASKDLNLINYAIIALTNALKSRWEAEKPVAKPKAAKGKVKTFTVTVEFPNYDPTQGKMVPLQLTGEFESTNALKARKEAKEFYAQEHGTDVSEITVTDCVLKS